MMNEENNLTTNMAAEIAKQKLDHYSTNDNNFVGAQEITVTITLNEYRQLVRGFADKEISEVKNSLWKKDEEITKLKKEIEVLKKLLSHNDSEVKENE